MKLPCSQMASSNAFSVSFLHKIRDRFFSVLIKAIVRLIDSGGGPPRILSSPTIRRILNAFARMYGFEVNRALQEDAGQRGAWNLLRSIAEFGITIPQKLKAPVSVVWSLSYRCNLRCMHCYQNAGEPSPDELTIDEQLDIIDQMARVGVSLVVLSGGEPLTNPNLDRLIERIHMHRMTVSIDSNGVLMDRGIVNHLKELGVSLVQLSLDSVHAKSHDQFRGLDGAFQKTLDAVELCSQAGIFTTVATTATTLNQAESQQLISLARERGASRVVFFDLIPAGRGKDVQMLSLSQRQLLDLMALLTNQSSRDKGETLVELPQHVIYSSMWNENSISDRPEKALSVERFTVSSFFDCAGKNNLYRKLAAYLGGCPAGRLYCNIQPNGDVTPCMFMPSYPIAGNLRKQSFEEIWNGPVFEGLRDRRRLKGKCRECKFVTVCGGCRAKAATYEGDYLASDPTCPI